MNTRPNSFFLILTVLLIDTHTHLFTEEFDNDRNEVINRALSEGIDKMLLPNIDTESIKAMLDLEKSFPEHCLAMMGLHPCSVNKDYEKQLGVIRSWLEKRRFVAVGEIGMDYHWDKTFVNEQKACFRQQIEWAKEFKLPIVIHQRECFDDLFAIVQENNSSDLRGVFHCFTGTLEEANKILSLGRFMLGIGGVLTYKKSALPEVVAQLPLEKLVIETDSPYLTPAPHRGKRNESAYVKLVAAKIAEIKNVNLEEVAEVTASNANVMFDLQ